MGVRHTFAKLLSAKQSSICAPFLAQTRLAAPIAMICTFLSSLAMSMHHWVKGKRCLASAPFAWPCCYLALALIKIAPQCCCEYLNYNFQHYSNNSVDFDPQQHCSNHFSYCNWISKAVQLKNIIFIKIK